MLGSKENYQSKDSLFIYFPIMRLVLKSRNLNIKIPRPKLPLTVKANDTLLLKTVMSDMPQVCDSIIFYANACNYRE